MKKIVKANSKKLNFNLFKKINLSGFFNKIKEMTPKKRLKYALLSTILLTTVGYAALNTSLDIEGLFSIKSKFHKVYISSLKIDGVHSETMISGDGESFTFTTKDIKTEGSSLIDYEVTNNSGLYDAKVSLSCYPEHYNNTSLNYNAEEKKVTMGNSVQDTVTARTEKPSKTKIYDAIVSKSKGSDSTINYSAISSESNGQGVYTTTNTDSGNAVYFYRGNVTDNNVIFAGYCWQIIRTTETGGVKLLYNGTPNGGQCAKPSGNGIATINYNSNSNDNAYVGYMYGTPNSSLANTHANINDSLLKKEIDKWYEDNIKGKPVADYLEDTVWCNDRSIKSGSGTGVTDTEYGFVTRINSFTPSLKCPQATDRLTVASKYLKYPIATLTADETIYAGVGGPLNSDGTTTNNTTMFFNNGGTFWTMTPRAYSASKQYVQGVSYFGAGNLSTVWTNIAARTMGVRPAISLKAGTEISSGNGSLATPYVIGSVTQSEMPTEIEDTEYTCKLNIKLVEPENNLIGTEYCFGTQCFNVVGYDGENFKLLAKYNLLVGSNTNTSDANYGHQDPTARADKINPVIGTIEFGTTNEYSTSKVKPFVDSYVSWLNSTYGINATGRLIENDELIEVGCQLGVSQGCSATYNKHHEWLLATTFYTGTKGEGTDRIYLVGGDGFFGASSVTNATNRGIRPLIIIPKDKVDIAPPNTVVPAEWYDYGIFSEYYNQAYEKLQTLTLEEKVGQLLVASYTNTSAANNAIQNYHVGGVLFFEDAFTGKTMAQVQSMTGGLQANAKVPLMMAVDEEGGRVVRISPNANLVSAETTQYPNLFFTNTNNKTAWKLGRTLYEESGNNFDLVKQTEVVRNKVLKNLGLNMNFAPVVDIATPPAYISDRSFGSEPELVTKYATEVIKAGKNSGVSHSLKHFPGYGNNSDTHSDSSVDNTSMEELQNTHLVPFKAGINAGAETVMVTHNTVAALDTSLPASLSESVHNLLFNDLKFTGLSITDDLAMAAIGNKYSKQYLKAFKAGNHILLTSTSFATAHSEILNAVASGEITQDELDKRVFKVLAWKYYNGLL